VALYCQDCSITLFGRDFGEFAGITTPEETRQGIYAGVGCESCGYIEVDHNGARHSRKGDPPARAPTTPDMRAQVFTDGGPSICWHCRYQLVRVRNGFLFALVVDPIGNQARVHKACLPHVVGAGYREVQPDRSARTGECHGPRN
jgi:hypothetical protein